MNSYIEEYSKIFNGGQYLRNGKPITHNDYTAFDGGGTRTLADKLVLEIENRNSAVTILDYGCGLGTHWHKQVWSNHTKSILNILGAKVQGFYRYDPAYTLYAKKPSGVFDFIICADVLEHISESDLVTFFAELNTYVKKDSIVFYSISTTPSRNSFLDGTNMHITIKSPKWWFETIRANSRCKFWAVFNGKYSY